MTPSSENAASKLRWVALPSWGKYELRRDGEEIVSVWENHGYTSEKSARRRGWEYRVIHGAIVVGYARDLDAAKRMAVAWLPVREYLQEEARAERQTREERQRQEAAAYRERLRREREIMRDALNMFVDDLAGVIEMGDDGPDDPMRLVMAREMLGKLEAEVAALAEVRS